MLVFILIITFHLLSYTHCFPEQQRQKTTSKYRKKTLLRDLQKHLIESKNSSSILAPPLSLLIFRERRENEDEEFEEAISIKSGAEQKKEKRPGQRYFENGAEPEKEPFVIQSNTLHLKSSMVGCLAAMNFVRHRFRLKPLEWDSSLSYTSQEWALVLAERGKLSHAPRGDNNNPFGENIYQSMNADMNDCRAAIYSWYS